jgi:hypothetical protein
MIFDSGKKQDLAILRKNWKYFGKVYYKKSGRQWWFWTNSKHQFYKLKHGHYEKTYGFRFVRRMK